MVLHTQAARNTETSALIAQALEQSIPLEKYPKAAIDVHIFVLESSGGVVGTATTCASLALADAGVELFDMVAGCSAAVTAQEGILLDPSKEEEARAGNSLFVAYMPALNEVTQVSQSGKMEHARVLEGIESCVEGCTKIHALMKACLRDNM